MFTMQESMIMGQFITEKLKRAPKSKDEVSKNLEKYFGMKTHPEFMTDFGMWTLNTVVNEDKILTESSVPAFIKQAFNDPKRDYSNYTKDGVYTKPN